MASSRVSTSDPRPSAYTAKSTPATSCSVRTTRSEEHTSELQSPCNPGCRLLLEKKNNHLNRPEANLGAAATRHPSTWTHSSNGRTERGPGLQKHAILLQHLAPGAD